jgi:cytochrome c5
MKNMIKLGLCLGLFLTSLAQAADQAVIDHYNKSCTVCHAVGVANAPKTGDVAQWEPRMAKGMDQLISSVDKGLNAMPPKGMCFDCTPEDIKALIEYMSTAQ